MLEGYRNYFRTLHQSYIAGTPLQSLDKARVAGRLGRSNFEASVDRASSEPGVSKETVASLSAILASSHRLAHALIALEAALPGAQPAMDRFGRFANDADETFATLIARLRGNKTAAALPDLREDYHELVQAGEESSLVNVEVDRITNSLNTLSQQVLAWTAR
jgi:hypothetical protein